MGCEVTSLRDRQYLQDQLDTFNILREDPELSSELDKENEEHDWFSSLNENADDIARQYNIGKDFWQHGTTDIPWQLGEGTRFSLLDTDLGTNAVALTVDDRILSRHERYANSVLVRALFQCYYRTDGEHTSEYVSLPLNSSLDVGLVLTMSPISGISYLDRAALHNIQANPGTRAAKDKASFIRTFMDKYSSSGTADWPCKSPEYFIVDMLTELLPTPLSLRTVPEIQKAYLPLVRELVGCGLPDPYIQSKQSRKSGEGQISGGMSRSISYENSSFAWMKCPKYKEYLNVK